MKTFTNKTITLSPFWHSVFSCSQLVFLAFILKSATKLLNMALSSHNHGSTYIYSRKKHFLAVAIDLFCCYCSNKCKQQSTKILKSILDIDLENLALATTVLLQLMPQNYFSREVKISIIPSNMFTVWTVPYFIKKQR